MVIQWKRTSASAYVATWRGMSLSLDYNQDRYHRWSCTVDGARCKQRWVYVGDAMDAVESAIARRQDCVGCSTLEVAHA